MSLSSNPARASVACRPDARRGPRQADESADGVLARFQDAFAAALLDGDSHRTFDSAIERLRAQPGFAVYRNTVLRGCIDALAANFPAVARLVGDEWFRAAAAVFVNDTLPRRPTLLDYGGGFPAFLQRFPPAAELPYLADVARLDRWWSEAHCAPDEAPLTASAVAALRPEQLERTVLRPHASARWAWFESMPIRTIWSHNRAAIPQESLADIDWCAEGVLMVRPCGVVETVALDAAACAFLDVCASGGSVADAAQASLAVDCEADLARLMATLLEAGAFGRLRFDNDQETEQEPS